MNEMTFEKRSFGQFLDRSKIGGYSADYGNIFDFFKTLNDESKRRGDNTLANLYDN